MSRTHLYRATAPGKPITSLVLAALWCGTALTAIVGAAPGPSGGGPLHGDAAAIHDRVFLVVAATALLAALVILVSELVTGRTRQRGVRFTGAALLCLAGVLGMLDTSRRVLRSGTPPATGDAATATATVRSMGAGRLFWTGLGVVGALTVLAGGVAALRQSGQSL